MQMSGNLSDGSPLCLKLLFKRVLLASTLICELPVCVAASSLKNNENEHRMTFSAGARSCMFDPPLLTNILTWFSIESSGFKFSQLEMSASLEPTCLCQNQTQGDT